MNPQQWFENNFINRIEGKDGPADRCRRYLLDYKKKEFPHCPKCGSDQFWEIKSRVLLHCEECNHQISPTANTVFHKVRKITHWFKAFWQMAGAETPSISNLKKVAGFGSRHTAIKCFEIIQALMGVANFNPLAENIYVGHTEITIDNETKSILIAAQSEDKEKLPKNIRIKVFDNVEDKYKESLQEWVDEKVNIYLPWNLSCFSNEDISCDNIYSYKDIEIPTVKKTYQLFEEWIKKNYRNKNSFERLDLSINEFIWRFNRYKLETNKTNFSSQWKQRDGFNELIKLAVTHKLTYE